jgi:hypothetical protein
MGVCLPAAVPQVRVGWAWEVSGDVSQSEQGEYPGMERPEAREHGESMWGRTEAPSEPGT